MYSHRQRPAHEQLARRRHDAVPQREEHQLGGRLPRAGDDPLARQDRGRPVVQRDHAAPWTGCRRSWPRPASRTSSRSSSRATRSASKTYKVHIDGYNLLPYLTGRGGRRARGRGFFYFSDDGDVLAMRFDNWKVVFLEQRCQGTLQIWASRSRLRVPKIFNLRTDPFEHADITSNTYWDWMIDRVFIVLYAGAAIVLRSSWIRSRSSRRARRRPASASIKRWRRWNRP